MRGPHTITVYNRLSEVDRRAVWHHSVVDGVRVEEKSGEVASMLGKTSTDGVLIMIPMHRSRAYFEPRDFDGEGWTLREGDSIAPGARADAEPPEGAWVVTGIEPIRARRGRLVALEVSAR